MSHKIKRYISLVLVLGMLLSLAACTLGKDSQQDNVQENDPDVGQGVGSPLPDVQSADNVLTLNYSMDSSLNPLRSDSTLNLTFAPLVYESLFEVDENFVVSNKLIKSYSSTDGKAWFFYVDTSVKFHDGTNLTAADAAYSIQRAMRHENYSARLSNILGVSAMDDELFLINLITPDTQLPALLNIPVIKYGAIGDDAPAGTGPYKFSEDLKSLVVFEDHPDANKLPIDVIYLEQYTTAEETIMAFEDEAIDIVTNDPTGLSNLGYGSANQIRYFNTTSMHYIGFNMESSFLKYTNHRYAFNYIIDREYIVSDLMNNCAVVATLPIHPASPLYNSSYAASFGYDLDKALRILRNADVEDHDTDGKLEYLVTGIPIEIEINFIVNNDSVVKVAAARRITETLQEAGMPVKLRELSWSDYKLALEEGDFDMYYGEVKLTADFDTSALLTEGGSLNYGKVTDPTYEQYISEYLSAFDDTRDKAADLMCNYIVESAPIIPICFEKQEVLTHRGNIKGMKPTQYNIFNKFTEWTIDMGED